MVITTCSIADRSIFPALAQGMMFARRRELRVLIDWKAESHTKRGTRGGLIRSRERILRRFSMILNGVSLRLMIIIA
jgi:hypothetical protein